MEHVIFSNRFKIILNPYNTELYMYLAAKYRRRIIKARRYYNDVSMFIEKILYIIQFIQSISSKGNSLQKTTVGHIGYVTFTL